MLRPYNCNNSTVRNRGRTISLQILFPILKSVYMNQAYAPFIFSKCSFCGAVCVSRFSWLDSLWSLYLTFMQNEHSLLAVLLQTADQKLVAILCKLIDQSHQTVYIANITWDRFWHVWIVLLFTTLRLPQKANIQGEQEYQVMANLHFLQDKRFSWPSYKKLKNNI